MKNRLFKTVSLFLTFTVVGMHLLSAFVPAQSYAAGEQYMIYWPDDAATLTKLEKSIKDGSEDGFNQTFVGTKGGFFGNGVTFNFNKQEDLGGGDSLGHYWYKYTYSCVKGNTGQAPVFSNYGEHIEAGKYNKVLNAPADLATAHYTIEVQAAVPLNPDRGAGGSYWNSNSPNEWSAGITHWWYDGTKPVAKNGQVTPDRVHYDSGYNDGEFKARGDEGGNISIPPPPDSCIVSPFGWSSDNNGTKLFNLKKYQKMSATEKAQWDTVAQNGKKSAATAAATSSSNGGTNESPSCESNGSVLGWLLCPIINGVADALNSLYSGLIQPLLRTRPLILTPGSNDPNKTYDVWNNFRIYGNILLVIVLLIVVFGESIGGGLIDAYTARKILPRLLIGAILINLSIYIVAFGMDVTNILGNGLQSLIQAPFQAGNDFKLNIFGANPGFSDDALGIVAVIGGLWTVAAVWGPISFLMLFILVPTLIVMALIVGILLVRQGLILLLIFAAPIAFALWCLPNTEQYFKRWWDTLFRTLLIYPIVAVIFAMANVLSVTISNTTTSLKVFSGLLAVICLFAPLYLIPFAFQIAGGIMGTLGNLGKRVSAGGMGWAKNTRGNIAKQNVEGMKTRARAGNYFRTARADGKGIRNKLNRGIQSGAIYGQAKRELGTRGVFNRHDFNGVRTSVEGAHMREMYDKDPALAAVKSDSTLLKAMAHGDGSKASIRKYLEQNGNYSNPEDLENATSKAHRARRVLGGNLARRTAAAGQMGTTDGHIGGSHEAALAISAASQGDLTKFNEDVAWGRQLATQSGRVDLLAGHGAYLDAREALVNARSADEIQALAPQLKKTLATSAGNSITPQSMASADAGAAGRLGETLNENLQEKYRVWEGAVASGDQAAADMAWEGVAEASAPVLSVYDTMSYAKADTAKALQKSLTSQKINSIAPSGAPMVRNGAPVADQQGRPVQIIEQVPVSTWLDQVRSNEQVRTYRREGSASPGARMMDGDGNPMPSSPVTPTVTGPGISPQPSTTSGSSAPPTPPSQGPRSSRPGPLYLDVGGKKVRATEDEYMTAMGYDPRSRQGPSGEDSVITTPVSGMSYKWNSFVTPDGRKSRILQEVDSTGKVVRPNVVLEAGGGKDFKYSYDESTKRTSIVDSSGRAVVDSVPSDWVGWQYGEPPISRRAASGLKNAPNAAKAPDDTTLTVDHSPSSQKLSTGDLIKGATEAMTATNKAKDDSGDDEDDNIISISH